MDETFDLRKYVDCISEFCLQLQERVKKLEEVQKTEEEEAPRNNKGECKIYKLRVLNKTQEGGTKIQSRKGFPTKKSK